MKVSVCVPTSRADSILPLLQSIQKQTWQDWELIAVGQGSCENPRTVQIANIVESVRAKDARIRYVHIDQAGACRAKNAAIAAARGEILAAIDDDLEASPDWLEKIVRYLDENPHVDVVGGSVLKPPKTQRGFAVCPNVDPVESIYDPKTMQQAPPGWNWIGCNFAAKSWVFEKVGFYDDHLGPGSTFPAADDTDILLRFEAAQIVMGVTPRLVVQHTYGYRYGFRAFTRHQYNYAYGNGGLAAKMVLSGDPRGQEWLHSTQHERLLGWMKPFRPHQLIRGAYGWFVFKSAYDRCLREFRVENDRLVPRTGK